MTRKSIAKFWLEMEEIGQQNKMLLSQLMTISRFRVHKYSVSKRDRFAKKFSCKYIKAIKGTKQKQ